METFTVGNDIRSISQIVLVYFVVDTFHWKKSLVECIGEIIYGMNDCSATHWSKHIHHICSWNDSASPFLFLCLDVFPVFRRFSSLWMWEREFWGESKNAFLSFWPIVISVKCVYRSFLDRICLLFILKRLIWDFRSICPSEESGFNQNYSIESLQHIK